MTGAGSLELLAGGREEWRDALAAEVRDEFHVDVFLPPRENVWLYGVHCSVASCERPGNELLVDDFRLCQRHAKRYRASDLPIAQFVASAPAVAARSPLTGLPRYDLTAASTMVRDELRFLMQALHDGHFNLTLSSKRWNALRRIYADSGSDSLLDVNLGEHSAAVVATSSAKRFQAHLELTRRRLMGEQPSRHDDVWTRELYGPFAHPMQSRPPRQMDFRRLGQPWLREAAKSVAWTRMTLEQVTPTTAWDMVRDVMAFADWAGERLREPPDITRELLVDYLVHVRASGWRKRDISQRLSRLRLFIDHARVEGLKISSGATYLPGELAVREQLASPPRYFDDRELAQLDDEGNLTRLSPFNRRAYLILRHTGMRTRSLVHVPFDCLTEVAGAPYLRFFNTKSRGAPQEHTIPIGPDLAAVVREQQEFVRARWPSVVWLFPARNGNPEGTRPAHGNSIYNVLVRWVRDCGLEARDGQELHFWPHRLRHSVGTQMLNQGVPQRVVQDYYGHASPEMTAHYAKLLDSTLRKEFDAFQVRVNRHGERVDVLPAGVSEDAVLLKERMARAKQTLPNGYCGIPVQQKCPHPNACLSCNAFLTDESFRPILEDQRQRASERAEAAIAAGHDRIAEVNLADVAALETVLHGLDELNTSEVAEEFDVRTLEAS